MTVIVQRPGETPEPYESYIYIQQAEECRDMLVRSEPSWRVWVADTKGRA
jgi:hypothetical protein